MVGSRAAVVTAAAMCIHSRAVPCFFGRRHPDHRRNSPHKRQTHFVTDKPNIYEFGRKERWRLLKDKLVGRMMAIGGISVIIAILLIFVYLLYVVLPLFLKPSVRAGEPLPVTDAVLSAPLVVGALDEYAETALLVDAAGNYVFSRVGNGETVVAGHMGDGPAALVETSEPDSRVLAVADAEGRVFVYRHDYTVSFPNNVREVTPTMTEPLGDVALETAGPVSHLAVGLNEDEASVIAVHDARTIELVHAIKEVSFLDDSVTVETEVIPVPYAGGTIVDVEVDIDQRELYVADDAGRVYFYDIQRKASPTLVDTVDAVADGARITRIRFLSGGISLLVGDSRGGVAQWFPVRDNENNYQLARVRTFKTDAPVIDIAPEYYRKGFAVLGADNRLTLFHATAQRRLVSRALKAADTNAIAFAPRADALITIGSQDAVRVLAVHNEHPEVSWHSLWQKVWYESRSQPEYIWQSSSASSDFEPKFSLTPLTFGTLKASFYAMLFAVPLAIFGAVYTAYFMDRRMRQVVKPSIEVMEAMPTVILGFLAGLWLAPLIEHHLPGVLALALILPGSVVLASFLWSRAPAAMRHRVPAGLEAALLLPVVALAIALALTISYPLERMLFDGDMPGWLTEHGIDYDQRNSLVVGLAMGFAVIPTIFSISEDAVFSVPRHLTTGSLALGATPWQTVVRVVLLTASPGIFSAVMIGLGRAVGETMIVLMATGNTPIMDANIFQGFRALSANIAVEMPESEVASTHYRILFLAALVLFMVTFVVNTAAELVRQSLRKRYSSL